MMWTDEELRGLGLKMRISPLITCDDVSAVDRILQCGNESQTGEEIRKSLFEAGFRVVKIDSAAFQPQPKPAPAQ